MFYHVFNRHLLCRLKSNIRNYSALWDCVINRMNKPKRREGEAPFSFALSPQRRHRVLSRVALVLSVETIRWAWSVSCPHLRSRSTRAVSHAFSAMPFTTRVTSRVYTCVARTLDYRASSFIRVWPVRPDQSFSFFNVHNMRTAARPAVLPVRPE